jgi:hypothetical protein
VVGDFAGEDGGEGGQFKHFKDPLEILSALPPPEEVPPEVLHQMVEMISALQDSRALLVSKGKQIKALKAELSQQQLLLQVLLVLTYAAVC